jgi:hypothetical protein
VLEYLRRRKPEKVREAIKADMIEGGLKLIALLKKTGGTHGMTPETES